MKTPKPCKHSFHLSTNKMISYFNKKNNRNFKNFKNIIPSDQEILKINCPKCHSTGQFYRHGFYVRFLFVLKLMGSMFTSNNLEINVLRLKCRVCGKTHAVLDVEIIPYCRYSIHFVLEVLASYYIEKQSIEDICSEFGLSCKTFKMFLRYYKDELIDLKAYFNDGSLNEVFIFEELIHLDIIDFLTSYFHITKRYLFHFHSSGFKSTFVNRSFHITFFVN